MAINSPISARDIDGVRPMHTMLCMKAAMPSTTHTIANIRIVADSPVKAIRAAGMTDSAPDAIV
jgi:hypothetical protein